MWVGRETKVPCEIFRRKHDNRTTHELFPSKKGIRWGAVVERPSAMGQTYCAVQKNSVPAAAGAVATSHTVFLLNIVQISRAVLWMKGVRCENIGRSENENVRVRAPPPIS